ncbi:MAG TPA: hypothetical protein VNY75_09565, partial [Rhizomicrobium sp.]|nr:hypothetical protein [Rhizomicrobium sp.]
GQQNRHHDRHNIANTLPLRAFVRHDAPFSETAGQPAEGRRHQRVSPVRLMRAIERRARSRQTPKAEM